MDQVIEILERLDEAFSQANVKCRPFFNRIEADSDGVYLMFSGCLKLDISEEQFKQLKSWL